MKLTGTVVKYSPQEKKIFAALRTKPQNTLVLKDRLYTSKAAAPFNSRQTVIAAIRSLSKKLDANKEPYVIKQTKHAGPHPMSFWIEQK